ncbi:ribonuclease P/MRP subunit p21 [Rhinolophus ferrumequinum]|uniref:Ribonuclease P/MRP subunit p21 n=1 Tax=Rhinolophus ferrumequinum TaxID=59479 RepID=A0A7J7YTS2_RHIFE|nr:ribonuclease P/MRP subunit p21 [Rhinolophus ferrumequinum]
MCSGETGLRPSWGARQVNVKLCESLDGVTEFSRAPRPQTPEALQRGKIRRCTSQPTQLQPTRPAAANLSCCSHHIRLQSCHQAAVTPPSCSHRLCRKTGLPSSNNYETGQNVCSSCYQTLDNRQPRTTILERRNI